MKNGFTLVELSIVLVIIGLLIGGILVGQSLIEAAKNHKMVSALVQYEVMYNDFKMKFKAVPGDSAKFTPAGDGNGFLDAGAGYPYGESYAFWAHLNQAGYIKRSFSCPGLCLTSWLFVPFYDSWVTTAPFPEEVVPKTPWGNSVFYIRDWRPRVSEKYLTIGIAGISPGVTVLDGVNSLALDSKIDDSLPGSGNFFSEQAGCGAPEMCFTNSIGGGCGTTANSRYQTSNSSGSSCYGQYIIDR